MNVFSDDLIWGYLHMVFYRKDKPQLEADAVLCGRQEVEKHFRLSLMCSVLGLWSASVVFLQKCAINGRNATNQSSNTFHIFSSFIYLYILIYAAK